ncbi:MAG: TIGR01777 family oxidoreductase [Ignavibacteria bacterium]|nr:TIGR01777 family oxidoreductase [Ignavibacteria bacterium]
MKRKVLIVGITGLIGKKLANALKEKFEVRGLVRNKEQALKNIQGFELYEWSMSEQQLLQMMEDTNVVINLSGKSIAKGRWTKKAKEEIYNSRILTTKKLADLICRSSKKPDLFIVASAVGYYGLDIDKISDEDSPPSNDFLGQVCVDWEKASESVDEVGVRRVNIRISTVLSRDGGALPLLALPFKFFAGTYFGSGKQFLPWIHEKDLINLFEFVIENENVRGPINAVSPQSITMKEFCKTIGKVLNKPCWIRIPEWKAKILFGEMSELLIKGGRVIPKKAQSLGFKFEFENIELALRDLLKS